MAVATRARNQRVDAEIATLQEWPLSYIVAVVGAGLLVVVGLAGAITQWSSGLGVTGMNTPTYWGLYVVNFVFMVGVSAGGILIASLVYAFGLKRFEAVGRMAELAAIISLTLAVIFITIDMGRPDRVLNLLMYGRITSPLVWDFIVVAIYMATALTLGYYATRRDLLQCAERFPSRRWLYSPMLLGYKGTDASPPERDRRILRVLALVAIPGAVALHSVTAWIMGLLKARAGWHNALLAPLFIVSAVVSGLALVTLIAVAARRVLKLRIGDDVVLDLGRLMAWGIPVLGYFLFAEMLTVVYAGETGPAEIFHAMVSGRFRWLFWFDLVAGLLLPWLLLVIPAFRSARNTGLAAGLVLLGVLAERALIVLPSLAFPMLAVASVPYIPTVIESIIVFGVYGLGVFGFALLAKLFPLVPLHEED